MCILGRMLRCREIADAMILAIVPGLPHTYTLVTYTVPTIKLVGIVYKVGPPWSIGKDLFL